MSVEEADRMARTEGFTPEQVNCERRYADGIAELTLALTMELEEVAGCLAGDDLRVEMWERAARIAERGLALARWGQDG